MSEFGKCRDRGAAGLLEARDRPVKCVPAGHLGTKDGQTATYEPIRPKPKQTEPSTVARISEPYG